MLTIAEPLIRRYDVPGPRYTSYPPVPAWNGAFAGEDWADVLRTVPREQPFALYAHFPFCATRCLYCGCNAIPTARSEKIDTYLDDLAHELALVTDALGWGRSVQQMHWGGGTPNLLTPRQTERALRLFRDAFDFAPDAQLSVECDPRVVRDGQMTQYRELGFSRVSFGVQDLDETVQRAIGRLQPLPLVQSVVAQAREAGFTEINLDLIYGLPHQTRESVDATIDAVLELQPDRLACFAYAHLPAQRPHQAAIPLDALPNTIERVALFRHIVERLTDAGFAWIGFDHFARHDDPLAVAQREGRLHRNFMGYTTDAAPNLLGVGTSAISEVNGCFAQNASALSTWRDTIAANALPVLRGHRQSDDDRRRGAIIKQLLCNLELPFAAVPDDLSESLAALAATAADGLVRVEPTRVVVTELGRYFLRNLCLPFDAYLPARSSERVFSRTL